ncbi:L-threonylcarbamoyladenylate synthase [Rhabdaerophilum calidifontis]|uniref:L-threonylcarbamoyladenylate synthase n=1 Tax=Rhabdaerophilum calidifontis TaxID=2604328 RepID=UPI00123974C3|nr:L-threonylcarbamoyladenylate synthase [Rhabdaerophilum calidifontis]
MAAIAPPRSGSGRPLWLDAAPAGIAEAARLLRAGALVAFPTETVYGLGADATDPAAIAGLYAAKGRPHFNPLIAHAATLDAALELGDFPEPARALARAFWPGPLTLVVPAGAASPVCELARAGLATLAIRVPDHPVAQAILAATGRPVAAPSANRSGHVSPTRPEHVAADLGAGIAAIVAGGASPVGVESTILACLDGEVALLRPGGLPRAAIEARLGRPLAAHRGDGAAPLAPGRLDSHYAPAHPVRLDAARILPGEACLGFGLPLPAGAEAGLTLNLSETGDLAEAAANLYHHLRALDARAHRGIAVAPIPPEGLGEAIRDRLRRAAAPRA